MESHWLELKDSQIDINPYEEHFLSVPGEFHGDFSNVILCLILMHY